MNENFSNLRIMRKPSHQSLMKRKQSAFSQAMEKPEAKEVVLNQDLNVEESVHSYGKSTITLNMDLSQRPRLLKNPYSSLSPVGGFETSTNAYKKGSSNILVTNTMK